MALEEESALELAMGLAMGLALALGVVSEQESAPGLDLGSGGEDVKIVRSW